MTFHEILNISDRIGVAQGTVGNWEADTGEPKLSQLEDIVKSWMLLYKS